MIDVNTATKAELIDYARDELGLGVDSSKTKAEIQDLVSKQLGQTVDADPDAPAEESPVESAERAKLNAQQRIKIRIFESPEHPTRIFIGVNGVSFVIKPGAIVEVPESVVEVLRNAQKTTYRQVDTDRGTEMKQQLAQSYPFEIISA